MKIQVTLCGKLTSQRKPRNFTMDEKHHMYVIEKHAILFIVDYEI
jgi:rRNA maturation protein Nop10